MAAKRLSFNDVDVVPFERLLSGARGGAGDHKGGPIWPDWDDQVAFLTHANRPPAGAVVLVVMVLVILNAMAGQLAV